MIIHFWDPTLNHVAAKIVLYRIFLYRGTCVYAIIGFKCICYKEVHVYMLNIDSCVYVIKRLLHELAIKRLFHEVVHKDCRVDRFYSWV